MNKWLKVLFGFAACWYSQSIPVNNPMPVDILLTGLAATGCCESCGFKYCPSLDDCVKPWETYCKDFDFPYNIISLNDKDAYQPSSETSTGEN